MPFFTCFFFFNAPCQSTLLLDLQSLIFNLMPFGQPHFYYATPVFLMGISFYIYAFDLGRFGEHS